MSELFGKFIRCETKTVNDTFGTVVYEITDKTQVTEDGKTRIKCIMLGGTGPSARNGYPVWDTEEGIMKGIQDGVTKFITKEEAEYFKKEKGKSKYNIEI